MVIPLFEASYLILGSILIIPALSPARMRIITRYYPQRQVSAFHLGLRTRWFITGLFVLALLLGQPVVYALFGFAAFWAIKEQFTTLPTRRADRRTLFLIYMLIPIQMFLMSTFGGLTAILFLPLFAFICLPLLLWSVGKQQYFDALMVLQWSILSTVWAMSMVVMIWIEPLKTNPILSGAGLLLYLVGLAQLNIFVRKNVFFRNVKT